MSQKKSRRVSVELDSVQMVWLHSQHLFQKIEENSYSTLNEIKFFKNNNGVEIRFQGNEGDMAELNQAKEELMKVINNNQIRLIATSLHKDIYIRISREARKEFPKSYIIFLHYETFQNCCRKLQQKFNITSITPELDKLRKTNPHFCFLIAQKDKIDDIQKFTNRILHSEVSCASTTFSHKKDQPPTIPYKRTMSVSSLRGSFSDQNQEQYRLSIHGNPVEEQLFEMSESIMTKLTLRQMQSVRLKRMHEGSRVSSQNYQGTYISMTKKLYYANRLQLTSNPYLQPIYAYSMQQRTPNHWRLTLVTDKPYRRLNQMWQQHSFTSWKNKIDLLLKVGKGLNELHKNRQTYCGLCLQTVLIDESNRAVLGAAIEKQIPPHTNAFQYDIRQYLLLIYHMFTSVQLTYQMLMFKLEKEQYFCTLSHKTKNKNIKQFLDYADMLFIGDITLTSFIEKCDKLQRG